MSVVAAGMLGADPQRAGRLASQADRIAADLPEEPSKVWTVTGIAATIAVTDPDRAGVLLSQAAVMAEGLADPVTRSRALAVVAWVMQSGDPDRARVLAGKAADLARGLPDGPDKAQALAEVALAVADSDPDAAVQWSDLARQVGAGIADPVVKASTMTRVARLLQDVDPVLAANALGEAERAVAAVGDGLVRADLQAAITGTRALTDPAHAPDLLGQAIPTRLGPAGAGGGAGGRRWVDARVGGWVVVGAAAREVAVTDPDQAVSLALSVHDVAGQSWVLTEVALTVAATSVDRAVEVIGKIPEELARVNALELLGDAVAAAAPERATRLYAEADRLARTHLRSVAAVDPGSAAGLARGVPDPTARAWALVEVAAAVGTRDGLLGQQLVSEAQAVEGVGRDPVSQMARAAAGDPDYAERIARTVSDRTARAWALTSVAKVLLETDPARAVRLLTDAADLQARAVLVGDVHLRSDWRSAREKAFAKVSAWAVGPAPTDAATTMFAGADDRDPDAARAGWCGRAVHPCAVGAFWQSRIRPRLARNTTGTTKADSDLTEAERQLQREIDELERQRDHARTTEEQHRTHTLGAQPDPDQAGRTSREHDHEQRAQAWFEHHLTRTPKPCLFTRLLTALVPGKPTARWKDDTVQDWGAIGDDETDAAPSSADDYQPPTTRARTEPPTTRYATPAPTTRYATPAPTTRYPTAPADPQYSEPQYSAPATAPGDWPSATEPPYATPAPTTRYPTAPADPQYSAPQYSEPATATASGGGFSGAGAPYATPAGPSGATGLGDWTGSGRRSTRTRSVRFSDQVRSTPTRATAPDWAQSLYEEGAGGPST
ncbi:MAG TPA: hypothetical protein VFP72_19010, partial [Kineosporiaceae bacterium]|nr:hypothetical protein [Kineosporiaceae bacterium]